jgi:hypothetical protein
MRRSRGAHGQADLRTLLTGGDRRSLARSARALALIEAHPARIAELARLAMDIDGLVSMRAMDLLEKIAHSHPERVQPHKQLFIGPLADSERWEIRLQVVRALPLLTWTPGERRRVIEILRRDLRHVQKFVRAWALDSLAIFACGDAGLRRVVLSHARTFERSGSKSLATRARRVRERLSRTAATP